LESPHHNKRKTEHSQKWKFQIGVVVATPASECLPISHTSIDTRCPTGHQIFGSDALLDKGGGTPTGLPRSLLGIDTRCPTGHQIFGSDALLDKGGGTPTGLPRSLLGIDTRCPTGHQISDLMLCWTKVAVYQQVLHGRCWASTPGVQQVIRFRI
jgi:hypothetical protein